MGIKQLSREHGKSCCRVGNRWHRGGRQALGRLLRSSSSTRAARRGQCSSTRAGSAKAQVNGLTYKLIGCEIRLLSRVRTRRRRQAPQGLGEGPRRSELLRRPDDLQPWALAPDPNSSSGRCRFRQVAGPKIGKLAYAMPPEAPGTRRRIDTSASNRLGVLVDVPASKATRTTVSAAMRWFAYAKTAWTLPWAYVASRGSTSAESTEARRDGLTSARLGRASQARPEFLKWFGAEAEALQTCARRRACAGRKMV
mmetsp:Transcript_68039/g.220294  ORF Transcript_68039/g.220294 Transcript_68039/m.220294 type:complete len:254 (-) Transcript_68039:1341-2102(-)